MAEQEIVAKHGKNVIQLMTKKEHPFTHRLKEIAIEVATIVFAVTMSIWLHGLSEHHHKQQEVKTFLTGLRADLADDVAQLEDVKLSYRSFDANHAYLAGLDPKREPDWEQFDKAFVMLNMNRFFLPTKSRYDGFQMSGKLTNIEDEKLLTNILGLYQDELEKVKMSEGGWMGRQRRVREYVDAQMEYDDRATRWRIVSSPRGNRLLHQMKTGDQLYERYQQYIDKSRAIIKQIDAAYPELAAAAKVH